MYRAGEVKHTAGQEMRRFALSVVRTGPSLYLSFEQALALALALADYHTLSLSLSVQAGQEMRRYALSVVLRLRSCICRVEARRRAGDWEQDKLLLQQQHQQLLRTALNFIARRSESACFFLLF